jgi:capsular polysaccharide biosynthesis protein
MERGQQGERLQVIEQPSVPQKPTRPQRLKWYAVAFALASMIGAGSVFGTEMLDGSIRGSRDLERVIDRHLIVNIPFLSTPGEEYRRRRKLILICTAMVAVLTAAIVVAVVNGVSVDFFWVDRSWLDSLTGLLR